MPPAHWTRAPLIGFDAYRQRERETRDAATTPQGALLEYGEASLPGACLRGFVSFYPRVDSFCQGGIGWAVAPLEYGERPSAGGLAHPGLHVTVSQLQMHPRLATLRLT